MKGSRGTHRVHLVHRIGAAAFGALLCVFAGTSLARGVPLFDTHGGIVWGLSVNGVLAAISAVAGLVLLGAAFVSARTSSTIFLVVGGVFLLAGLAHLGLIHTPLNVLAFSLPNVFSSLVVGLLLLFLGAYGRLTGGLPPDNPYRRAHPVRRDRPSPDEQMSSGMTSPREQGLLEAELAVVEGKATPEQEEMVRRDQARRRSAERARAYRKHRGSPGTGGG